MFHFTVFMYILSGISMIAAGFLLLKEESKGASLGSMAFGLAALAYGVYLALFFNGGDYWVLWKIFIVPPIVIVYAIVKFFEKRKAVRTKQQQVRAGWQAPAQASAQWPGQQQGQWPAQQPGQWPAQQHGQWPGQQPAGPAYAPVPQPTWQPSANAAPFTPPAPQAPPASPTLSSDDVLGR